MLWDLKVHHLQAIWVLLWDMLLFFVVLGCRVTRSIDQWSVHPVGASDRLSCSLADCCGVAQSAAQANRDVRLVEKAHSSAFVLGGWLTPAASGGIGVNSTTVADVKEGGRRGG